MDRSANKGAEATDLARKFLVFLDGPSASGKSTLKDRLLSDPDFHFEHAKRHTTREPRPDDTQNNDYIFTDAQTFSEMKRQNQFVECRDFKFGMSYGISISELIRASGVSDQILSLMNLGGAIQIRERLPDALCVIADVPPEQIEQRLRARGYHTERQIAERIENAREARLLHAGYDFVLDNSNGKLDVAYLELKDFLLTRYAGREQCCS